MYFAVPDLRSTPTPEPASDVVAEAWVDTQWNRPVFKAPPLKLNLSILEPRRLAEELRRIGPIAK